MPTHSWRSSVRSAVLVVWLSSIVPLVAAAGSLPSGAAATDIGSPSLKGSASFDGSRFTVDGAGADIWGTRDQFMFVYAAVTGDVTIVARVDSLQYTHAWAKAGVMMRETLQPGSRHAFALVSAGSGMAFQRRTSTGGSTASTSASGAAPRWVRLQRKGSTFTAARSSDGSSWTTIGSQTISMSSTIYVGLAVTSHTVSARARATFSHVAIHKQSAGALPSGWSASDIGSGGLAGSSAYVSGVFSIDGSGRDVWGTADQFRFTYRQVSGDVDVVARVDSLENVDPWAKAGVMIRRSLNANAAHASMFVSAASGLAFQRRATDGGTTVHTSGGSVGAPRWVKLSRRGSTITAYQSSTGTSWTQVGTQTLSLPSTFYVGLAVTSHNPSVLARATFSSVAVTAVAAGSLPSGWGSSDIGSGVLRGSAAYASGVFTIEGAGADIWGTSDQFRFTYRQASGDIDIVARVTAIEPVDPWAKAGVMIRRSLSAGAGHASMFVSAGRGLAFQRRGTDGGSSLHTGGGSSAAPRWVKLSRRGSTISAYQSSDGSSWTLVGTQSLSLPSTFYVGLAVTSHNSSALATATFSGVSVQAASSGSANQDPAVSLTSPASGAKYTAPASIPLAASASDSDGTIARVEFYAGTTLIGSDATAPYSMTWGSVPAGSYSITAVARDNAGGTTVSGARSVTVVDPQMPGRAVFSPSSNHATAVDRYVVEFFTAGANPSASNPIATVDIGKPPIVSGEITADVSKAVASLPRGSYIATVTAIGPGGSARSAPSPAFTRP